jgi:heme/copper-type cytochrome/quinol oxidase subunit 2
MGIKTYLLNNISPWTIPFNWSIFIAVIIIYLSIIVTVSLTILIATWIIKRRNKKLDLLKNHSDKIEGVN